MLSSESPVTWLQARLTRATRSWTASSLLPARMWQKMRVSSVGSPDLYVFSLGRSWKTTLMRSSGDLIAAWTSSVILAASSALVAGASPARFSQVAGAKSAEDRTPSALLISADECAHAGLEALARGRRTVVPRLAVRLFVRFCAHAPRAIWLPLCRRLFA